MTSALACALLAAVSCQSIAGIEQLHAPVEGTPDTALCQRYCTSVMEKCSSDYAVYSDHDQCMSTCFELPAGEPDDHVGNSVSCRYNSLQTLIEERDCQTAGPGGGGANACGDSCASYCRLMSKTCDAEGLRDYWLSDEDTCVAACRGLRDRAKHDPKDESSVYSAGSDPVDASGDTLQCRLFHAVAASSADADTECAYAALSPHVNDDAARNNPCRGNPSQISPTCEDYCRLISVACSGERKVYQSEVQCLASCDARAFEPGSLQDSRASDAPSPNTLGCRYTHAYNALISTTLAMKMDHCGHASPSGDGICGDPCESYCAQLQLSCSDVAGAMSDLVQCQSVCKGWKLPSEPPYSVSVALAEPRKSTVACRLFALTEARANPEARRSQCERALGDECDLRRSPR